MRRFSFVLSLGAAAVSLLSLILLLSTTRNAAASGNFDLIQINFSNAATVPPGSYLRDHGEAYGVRTGTYQGGGIYSYGWVQPGSSTPLNLNGYGVKRSSPLDVRLASFMHMEWSVEDAGDWEIALPNGMYSVTVATGDSLLIGSAHWLSVENQAGIVNFVADVGPRFMTVTRVVWVNDGRLSLRQTKGDNTKINYVDIISTTAYLERPSVISSAPANAQTEVSLTPTVTVTLDLPNGAIDGSTITTETVRLTRLIDGAVITAAVTLTASGETITLQPTNPLDLNVTYLFEISDSVKDVTGAAVIPYQSFFTAASGLDPNNGPVAFQKTIAFSSSNASPTSLALGPDGKLYVGTLDGNIYRFNINPDGALSGLQTISTVRDNNGGSRAILGMAFDPAATADNLILWISNNPAVLVNAPDWSSKISRLTGANLENIEDVVIRLPRSYRDHMTNGLAFGPDGALYFMQGSNSTMGAPDSTWNFRPERLLSAAVLRLDTTAVVTTPLDVKTDEGGTYDPFAPGAPLTIYASGTRNSYDLLWHSNGRLYVPTNGSAQGGSTPGTPATLPEACQTRRLDLATNGPYTMPQVITMTAVPQVQRDFLFRVEQGGYYGHPNPERCEWVMNGGNPTAAQDTAEVSPYPIGTEPDRNWRGAAFDFGLNQSPDGIIEYQSDSFGGYFQGKLIVARYSRGDDLAVLTPNAVDGYILSIETDIPGFTGMSGALDIIENPINGHLYVAALSSIGRVWLLRPIEVDVSLEKSVNVTTAVPFQTITYTLTLSNAGPMAATNVVVTDVLPGGLAPTTVPPQCDMELVCTIPSLAVGETVTLTLGAQVTVTTAATLTNTAAATANEFDRATGNNISTAVVEVQSSGHDLQITKVAETVVLLAEPIHYTLTITNAGPLPVTGVVVTDSLPNNVLLTGASPACMVGMVVVCDVGTLAVSETVAFTLTVVPTATGVVTNTAVVAGNEVEVDGTNNEAYVVTTVLPVINLALQKSAGTAQLYVSQLLTYTLVVTNNGPAPATGVVVTDSLPPGVAIDSVSADCVVSAVVVCDAGELAVSGTAVFTITAIPTATGFLTNTAVAAGNEVEANAADNEAQAVVEALALADVMVAKNAGAAEVVIGRLLTYTLTVTNNGPSLATQVIITDVLPAEVQLVGLSAGCSGDVGVVCEVGELAVGETAVLTLTVTPTAAGLITNTAQVSAAEFDGTLDNNQSQVTTSVLLEMMAVALNGPEEGLTGQAMSFTAVVTPITATQPITYIWQATGQETVTHTSGLTDTVMFTWALPGEQTVTVTAVNRWGQVKAMQTVVIDSRLYLPVVLDGN